MAGEKVFRLEDMEVQEVSLVDRAANEEKFLIVKRDTNMFGIRDLAAEMAKEEVEQKSVSKADGDKPEDETPAEGAPASAEGEAPAGEAAPAEGEAAPTEDEKPVDEAEKAAEPKPEEADKAAEVDKPAEDEKPVEAEKAEGDMPEERPDAPAAKPSADAPPVEEGGGGSPSVLELAMGAIECLGELVESLAGAGVMAAAEKAAFAAKLKESSEAMSKAMTMTPETKRQLEKWISDLRKSHGELSKEVESLKAESAKVTAVAKRAEETAGLAKELASLKSTVEAQAQQIAKLSKRVPAPSSAAGEGVKKGDPDGFTGWPSDYNARPVGGR